jgi:PTH1 family peptidyl-tRNA hydrolase
MKLIIGLGNPGSEYKHTRHNVGFETIDKLAYDFKVRLKKRRFRSLYGEVKIAGVQCLLVQPQTYMNLSGEAVRAMLQFYKLPPSEIIVVFDDVSLPVGDVRVRERGSAGGQNGMKSIIENLKTDEFTRVRIGIGAKPDGWDLKDYVLSRFGNGEWEDMINGITQAGDAVQLCVKDGVVAAMNKFNKRVTGNAPS